MLLFVPYSDLKAMLLSVINVIALGWFHVFLKVSNTCFDEDFIPLEELLDVT